MDVKNNRFNANDGEYERDGVWYCGVCNHPVSKDMTQTFIGKIVRVSCQCKETEAEKERHQKAENRREKAFEKRRSMRFGFTFANDDRRNPAASDTMKAYCENFDENKKQGRGIILHSIQNGGGKTYLACAVANDLIDRGYNVLVTDFLTLRDKLWDPKSFKDGNRVFVSKVDFLQSLLSYDLIVIDDLGVEQSTEFMLEVEYRIIDYLTDGLVPIILTTNYTLSELRSDDNRDKRRVFDRILGSCALLSVGQPNGKSRRVERCAELTRELTAQGAGA